MDGKRPSLATTHGPLAALMDRYLDGDVRAFRSLYEEVGPRVRRQVLAIVRDRALADDVLQATFLKAHQRRASFVWRPGDRDRTVVGWYAAIARNTAIDVLRQRGRRDMVAMNDDREQASTETEWVPTQEELLVQQQDHRDAVARVRRAVEQLPPGQREVVELHKLRGWSMDQIAEQSGVRSGTLRVRAHRAYRMLADSLRAKPEPEAAAG